MRVMLINSNMRKNPWPIPPIGLCYIASNTEAAGHCVKVLDLCFANNVEESIIQLINEFKPQVIGITIRNLDNNSWYDPIFFPEEIKKRVIDCCKANTNAEIVLGGAAFGINPNELLNYMEVNYGIQGEGEKAFPKLINALENAQDPLSVKGVVCRTKDGIKNNEYDRIDDLDIIETPQLYKWINIKDYESYNGSYGIQTKRGCPFKCVYCSYPKIDGSTYRLRSPEKIVDEIQDIVNNCNVSVIEFVDSTFNVPRQHALKICDEIIRRKIITKFKCVMSPVDITKELLEKMKKAGFYEIEISPESASPKILKSLGKDYTVGDIERTALNIKDSKISTSWYFMFGGPNETEVTINDTLTFIDKYISKYNLCIISAGIRINAKTFLKKYIDDDNYDNCFFPIFYESKELNRDKLIDLIRNKATYKRSNFIFLQDKIDRPIWLIRATKAVYKILNIRKPIWTTEITLRSIVSKIKVQSKGR